jgi:hypothetical protein
MVQMVAVTDMTKTTTGWIIFVAAIGTMFSLLAVDISVLSDWNAAAKPAFIGTFIGHIGAVIAAFVGGKLIPSERDPNGRVTDSTLKEINK